MQIMWISFLPGAGVLYYLNCKIQIGPGLVSHESTVLQIV